MRTHNHTRACLAAAMIAAIENIRDQDGQTDAGFRAALANGTPQAEAESYLRDGLMTCRCPN